MLCAHSLFLALQSHHLLVLFLVFQFVQMATFVKASNIISRAGNVPPTIDPRDPFDLHQESTDVRGIREQCG
jgi:hypothetical protein